MLFFLRSPQNRLGSALPLWQSVKAIHSFTGNLQLFSHLPWNLPDHCQMHWGSTTATKTEGSILGVEGTWPVSNLAIPKPPPWHNSLTVPSPHLCLSSHLPHPHCVSLAEAEEAPQGQPNRPSMPGAPRPASCHGGEGVPWAGLGGLK